MKILPRKKKQKSKDHDKSKTEMNKPTKRTEHVSEVEYLEAANKLNTEFNANGLESTLTTYVQKTSNLFKKTMGVVAVGLIRIDPDVPPTAYEIKNTKYAVFTGAVAGAALVRLAYNPYIISTSEIVAGLELDGDEVANPFDQAEADTQALMDFGWAGIRRAGSATENFLETWESSVVKDVRYQDRFRISAGFVIEAAYDSFDRTLAELQKEELEKFEKEIEEGIQVDWTQALQDMLRDDGQAGQ